MTSHAVMVKRSPENVDLWTAKIIADKPFRLAATAMLNKAARAIWEMLTKKQEYRQTAFSPRRLHARSKMLK
jgi:transposase